VRLRPRPWPLVVVALAVAGLVLRLVILEGRWGTIDSDEAVVGLMARDILDGEWRAFYWGQHYAGTQETALVALFGASRAALKLVPVGLCAVASVLTWRVGTRFLAPRAAVVAGLLTWLGPGAYVWWSTKERGFYWVTVVVGLALVLFGQRIVERDGRPVDWAGAGAAFGLGWWASPSIAYFVVPAGLYVIARRRPPLRWLPLGLVAAGVAALPWLWHNVEQGWPSLEAPPQPVDQEIPYADGIGRLLWKVLPMALNLRLPISAEWVLPVVGAVVYVGLGGALLLRRPPPLLATALVAFPFLYAAFPGRWWVGEGRYALFALPFLGLALAWLVRRPWPLAGLAAVWLGLSLVGLDTIGAESPQDLDADLAALESAGIDRLWADYWVAHRLAFESGGDLVAASHLSPREPDLNAAVAADPTPAVVYRRDDRRWSELVAALGAGATRRVTTPNFVAVLVDRPLEPAALAPGTVP